MSTSTCSIYDCAQPMVGLCIQCGKPYCAQHGGRDSGYGLRCHTCYERTIRSLVQAHYLAAKLPDAIAVLQQTDASNAPSEYFYYRGLALAANGDFDAAIESLERVFDKQSTVNVASLAETTRRMEGRILSARAVHRLRTNDVAGAVDDLRQAITVSEDNRVQREMVVSLVHQAAMAYFRAGRLLDAARDWEDMQTRDPQDLQVAHYLGIVYYRLASDTEGSSPDDAEAYWHKTIANWMMVFANQEFWSVWKQGRLAALGPIEDSLVEDIRNDIYQRLSTEFRNYHTQYLTEASAPDKKNNQTKAERHATLEAVLVQEKRAAEEMFKVMQESGQKQDMLRVVCGPLMLENWRQKQVRADLLQAVDNLAMKSLPLAEYLSSLGTCYAMVRDLKSYDDAQATLKQILKENPKNRKEVKTLLVEALLALGREHLNGNHPDKALPLLEEAAEQGDGVSNQETLSMLAEASISHTGPLIEDEASVQQAIDLLERLRKKYSWITPEFKAQLAQAYFKRGVFNSHKDKPKEALADLKQSLAIDPNNAQAKDNYGRAVNNRLMELINAKETDQAFTLLMDTLNSDMGGGHIGPDVASVIMFNHGIDRANKAIEKRNRSYSPSSLFMETFNELREALKELNTALQLANDNESRAHIQKQINAITAAIGNLSAR